MAHFLRGKQAGIQKDFSEGLSPDLFALDDVRRLCRIYLLLSPLLKSTEDLLLLNCIC